MKRYYPSNPFYYFLFLLFLMSCQPTLNRTEYMQWLENSNNEAVQIVETNQLKVECRYTPTDYILQKEIQNGVLAEEDIKSREDELDHTVHFKLSYTTKEGKSIMDSQFTSEKEAQAREHYLRMNAGKDSYLLMSGEKITPSISHLINNYGMKASTELLLGFEKTTDLQELKLVLQNKLIDTTEISFLFDLTTIPQLKK